MFKPTYFMKCNVRTLAKQHYPLFNRKRDNQQMDNPEKLETFRTQDEDK